MSRLMAIEKWIDSRRRHPCCSTDMGRALDALTAAISIIDDECTGQAIDMASLEILATLDPETEIDS